MARIFISYAREDFLQVRIIYHKLKDADFKPWMDKVDLIPGQMWRPAIERAIKQADFFILCVSNHSIKKRGFVQREVRIALDLWQEKRADDIYFIPVMLDPLGYDELPDEVGKFQWVEWDDDEGWERLLKAIEHGIEQRLTETEIQHRQQVNFQALEERQRQAEVARQREAKARQEEEQRKAEAARRREKIKQQQEEEAERRRKEQAEVERKQRAEAEREQQEETARAIRERKLADQRRRKEDFHQDEPTSAHNKRLITLTGLALLVLAVGIYWLWRTSTDEVATSLPTPLPSITPTIAIVQTTPTKEAPKRVEVLSYKLEVLTNGDFRLRFLPHRDGYLYFVAQNHTEKLITLLTNQHANLEPGTSNRLRVGVPFVFPPPHPPRSPYLPLKATDDSSPLSGTLIFSPVELKPPGFPEFFDAAKPFSSADPNYVENLRRQAEQRAPQTDRTADGETMTALLPDSEPLVFSITVPLHKRRKAGK